MRVGLFYLGKSYNIKNVILNMNEVIWLGKKSKFDSLQGSNGKINKLFQLHLNHYFKTDKYSGVDVLRIDTSKNEIAELSVVYWNWMVVVEDDDNNVYIIYKYKCLRHNSENSKFVSFEMNKLPGFEPKKVKKIQCNKMYNCGNKTKHCIGCDRIREAEVIHFELANDTERYKIFIGDSDSSQIKGSITLIREENDNTHS